MRCLPGLTTSPGLFISADQMVDSRIPGFYGWPLDARRRALEELTGAELSALNPGALELSLADKLIENVVGVLGIPIGLGLNFRMNGVDYLVPMAVEEPSVVAAFSHASKLVRLGGGFETDSDPSQMIGQLQLSMSSSEEADRVIRRLRAGRDAIARASQEAARPMERRGGGYREHELRRIDDPEGGPPMVVVHIIVDVVDAMGANLVNHVAETVAPLLEELADATVGLRILSNYCDRRLARATARVPVKAIGGLQVARGVAEADRFARIDPYRAVTHNKGFMNGVDAVAVATGNDWRAIEAACHAHAARNGTYQSLTRWRVEGEYLVGSTEVPMAVGTVGGITRSHPTIALNRRILGIEDAPTLSGLFAAAGLAQNFAAIKALSTEGIQRGHMNLAARQLAVAAGARPEEIEAVVKLAVAGGPVSAHGIAKALSDHRGQPVDAG